MLDSDSDSSDCEFQVQYKDSDNKWLPDKYDLKLLEDYQKNWVVVIGSVQTIDRKRKRNEDLRSGLEAESGHESESCAGPSQHNLEEEEVKVESKRIKKSFLKHCFQ